MSAAYFALRHPDRCWGLVLADAITQAPPGSSVRIVRGMNSLPDGLAWLMTRLAIHVGLPLMVRDAETRSMMRVFFENHPISARRAGVENDLAKIHALDEFHWEAVHTPALLIHGDRDPLIPLVYSQRVASRMPNAELSIVPGGGHECLVSHRQQVAPRLNAFLHMHT